MSRIQNFKPLFPTTGRITLSVYQDLNNKYESNPKSLKAINDVVDVLQHYIFSIRDLVEVGTAEEIFENKKQAALRVMDVADSLRGNNALYMDYLAIMAQNSVIVGDWNQAISYYCKMLDEDGVLNADYNESYYAGELELAAKVFKEKSICSNYSCFCGNYHTRTAHFSPQMAE